jgi:hypothetical protein
MINKTLKADTSNETQPSTNRGYWGYSEVSETEQKKITGAGDGDGDGCGCGDGDGGDSSAEVVDTGSNIAPEIVFPVLPFETNIW